MDCTHCKDLLPEFASGELDGEKRYGVERHLARCYLCREEMARYQAVLTACREVLRHPLPLEQWDELRSRLELEAPEVFPAWRRIALRRGLAGAFAAAAVVALAFWRVMTPGVGAAPPESADAPGAWALAPSGFLVPSDGTHSETPFHRYAATVKYYCQSLDVNSAPTHDAPPESPAPDEGKDKLGTSDAMIGGDALRHWYV